MASDRTERRLAAILSADVVGYSRLMAEDEAGTIRTVTAYREEVRGGRSIGRMVGESPAWISAITSKPCRS